MLGKRIARYTQMLQQPVQHSVAHALCHIKTDVRFVFLTPWARGGRGAYTREGHFTAYKTEQVDLAHRHPHKKVMHMLAHYVGATDINGGRKATSRLAGY